MPGARATALRVLTRVERDRAFAAAVFDAELRGVADSRDRALATEIVLGCLRRQSWLDYLLNTAAPKGLKGIDSDITRILRIGAYQLAFLARVPARAAVSEAVALARRSRAPGLASLVNAVLRNLAGRDRDSLRPAASDSTDSVAMAALRLGQQEWLFERLVNALGRQRAERIADVFNSRSRRTLRINGTRITRREVLQTLGDAGRPGGLTPWSIDVADPHAARRLEANGLAAYQDEGAQLVVLAANPGPGHRVLDGCAGRGGKTGTMIVAAGGQAGIVAADRHQNKLERLKLELDRQGLTATAVCGDLTVDPGFLPGPFDLVLLDAPCSGTGTLGRRPEIRWRIEEKSIDDLIKVQARMLESVAELVSPGGRLVYAVCSLLPDECEVHLPGFQERHPDFTLVANPPEHWPQSVPWNAGQIFIDPCETNADGYRMLCLTRA